MRNRTLTIVIALFLTNAGFLSAQTNQGKFLLAEMSNIDFIGAGTRSTMNFGWITYKAKSDAGEEDNPVKAFSLSLIPRVGYFVVNNLAVGLDISIDYSRSKRMNSDIITKYTQLTTGPFLRYYVPTKKFLPFAEANYSIGSSGYKWTSDNADNEHKYQVQQYGFGVGMGFPLGEKVSFDTLVGYQSHILKSKEDNEDNSRDIIGTIGLKLGLTIFL